MPQSPETGFPYHRIVGDLRTAIMDGSLAPGARLSSEWALATTYETSRPTVRRALAVLKAEGLVVTQQGQGAFVRSLPPVRLRMTGSYLRNHEPSVKLDFDTQVVAQGQHPEHRLQEVAVITPPADVAARMEIGADTEVLVRRRLFLVNDQPLATSNRYFPLSIAQGTLIAEPALVPGGLLAYIEDPDGPIHRTVKRSVDEVTSRLPTSTEAETLQIARGLPVVRLVRTTYDTDGMVLEVRDELGAADRFEFRYEANFR